MSKHTIPPSYLPSAKRVNFTEKSNHRSVGNSGFDDILYDEIILYIFSYLPWVDLCVTQPTNRNWARLAADNELWRNLYLNVYGRTRLRGAKGFIHRFDGREVKALPGRAKGEDRKNWKWMFRISSNWKKGRCHTDHVTDPTLQSTLITPPHSDLASYLILAGSSTITASNTPTNTPAVTVSGASGQYHKLCSDTLESPDASISAICLDQSPPANGQLSFACFYSTGKFSIFQFNPSSPSAAVKTISYTPQRRIATCSRVVQAAFYHPLLVTLSSNFTLNLFNLSSGSVRPTQTLSSFTSYPPTSLVLSSPSPASFRLVVAYSIPVYPRHWSAGATELIISTDREPISVSQFAPPSSFSDDHNSKYQTAPLKVVATRTVRAIDTPAGWIDERRLALMREQWARKVLAVADTQTDGKWLVFAPGEGLTSIHNSAGELWDNPSPSADISSPLHSPTGLQLYRLVFPTHSSSFTPSPPKLTFVRTLHGQISPASALALADGRCVSLGCNGSIWVWDLEGGTGAEVAPPDQSLTSNSDPAVLSKGSVSFDERKIVTVHGGKLVVRRFDV